MASGKNTPQYKKMLEHTPSLTNVLADGSNIVRLAGELVRAGLISKANERKMLNTAVDADIRAAELISMVTTKVDLNSQNFTTFLEALGKDQATYGDILTNMKKEIPPMPKPVTVTDPTPSPERQWNTAGSKSSVPSSLQRYTELEVLQQFHATLNSAIVDPDVFASHLITKGFMTNEVAANQMPLGFSNYRKVGNLLGVVDSHIKSSRIVSYERLREKFCAFLSILGSPEIGLYDIARRMEEQCFITDGTQSVREPQHQACAASIRGPPQPQHTTAPQPQTAEIVEIPRIFTKDMSIEQLALWLSHHQKLVGDFDDDINKLKGAKINGHSFLSLSEAGLKHLEVSFGFLLVVVDIIKELKAEQQQSQNSPQLSSATNSATTHTTSTAGVPSSQTQQPAGPYRRLRDEDHNMIYSKLASHADRWLDLGAALGFKHTELQLIQANPVLLLQFPPQSYLRQMLSQWLQWGPGDGRGSPDFANSVALYQALLNINLAPIAYELNLLLLAKQ